LQCVPGNRGGRKGTPMQSPQQKPMLDRLEAALREAAVRQRPIVADFYAPG